jgi:hypothetical protein
MRNCFITALLFLALFAFQTHPAALSKSKEAKRRLDIKINPVVDLSYMIRKYAASKSEFGIYGALPRSGRRRPTTQWGIWRVGWWWLADTGFCPIEMQKHFCRDASSFAIA